MRNFTYMLAALAFAGAVATGCSSSSSVNVTPDGGGDGATNDGNTKPVGDAKSDGKKDSGKDSGKPGKDGGPDSTTSEEGGEDAGEGGLLPDGKLPDGGECTFAEYVINLVNNDTTSTATPDDSLGSKCSPPTDDANQFNSLF